MEIHLLGTSHVSKESIRQIRLAVEEIKPTVIAVELDERRMHALLSKEKKRFSLSMIRVVGLKGFLFATVAMVLQQSLGKSLKIQPGSDMLEGVLQAKQRGIALALIDLPIERTLRSLSRSLSFRDMVRFIGDSLYSVFAPEKFARRYNLHTVSLTNPSQDIVETVISYLEVRFPSLYEVLVAKRNRHMAHQLVLLQKEGARVLAIVGAGHVQGIKELLDEPMYTHDVHGADLSVR